ncbi:MAG: RluA family pseudouridine synthase [Opitutae bacterium]|nr:RluA family pseudouridine synthase [Opitutae bacterium]
MDEKSRIEERSPLVSPEEFPSWILFEDQDLLVVNKPGWLVCHPSKNGPWSSLVGAGREYTGADRLYLAGRLDRETSGVVLLGKTSEAGKTWQMAVEKREVSRSYLAILKGELKNLKEVETHIGNDPDSPVFVKQRVTQPSRKSKLAQTCFLPLIAGKGHTLACVTTQTGRKHQIRVHAQHIGHPLVGDKLYGDDENLYLEFCQNGWTNELAGALAMHRQALHSSSFGMKGGATSFNAPMASDMEMFCLGEMGFSLEQLKAFQEPFLEN